MASIRQDKRTGRYLIVFRYSGRQFQRGLKTTSRKDADAARARVDETIRLIERGRLEIPDDADPVTFILSDGTQTKKPVARKQLTLGELLQMYDDGRVERAKEDTTVTTERIHLKHLRKYLTLRIAAQSVALADVQRYVARRLKDKWRGQPISVDTVTREIATLRQVWNWGEREGHVTGRTPTIGLQYPKRDQKHPFMTRDEIERIINRGGLTEIEEKELWESLFLKSSEVSELLPEAQEAARHPFIYPMFVFVAHTGARRSEIIRSQIDDFDFNARIVKIREKKRRKKNAITYRHVPMTALLQSVMQSWFATAPICSWAPPLPVPDLGGLAWQLNSRWNEPLVNTDCVITTQFAGRFFGGYGGRNPRNRSAKANRDRFLREAEVIPDSHDQPLPASQAMNSPQTAKGTTPEPFAGFENLDANFIYTPNQFFDVCLRHSSRGAVRLVAYLLRRTLGWLDKHGEPIEQDVAVSFSELVDAAGISRGAIRPAIDEAIDAGFVTCTRPGHKGATGCAAQTAQYRLRWDERTEYVKDPRRFAGFFAGEGNRTPIPNSFFDHVVRREPLAVVKLVGTVLRHTVGHQNQFGGRRSDAPLCQTER